MTNLSVHAILINLISFSILTDQEFTRKEILFKLFECSRLLLWFAATLSLRLNKFEITTHNPTQTSFIVKQLPLV